MMEKEVPEKQEAEEEVLSCCRTSSAFAGGGMAFRFLFRRRRSLDMDGIIDVDDFANNKFRASTHPCHLKF